MDFQYKNVFIYADSYGNLIIIPTGISTNWGAIMGIDCVLQLSNPYDDRQLVNSLKEGMAKCFSLIPDDTIKTSSLERLLGIKGYSKATKGRRLVSFDWNIEDGYTFTPTVKKKGYVSLEEQVIRLGHNPTDDELVKSFKNALSESTN
jgi:hypothetical protein